MTRAYYATFLILLNVVIFHVYGSEKQKDHWLSYKTSSGGYEPIRKSILHRGFKDREEIKRLLESFSQANIERHYIRAMYYDKNNLEINYIEITTTPEDYGRARENFVTLDPVVQDLNQQSAIALPKKGIQDEDLSYCRNASIGCGLILLGAMHFFNRLFITSPRNGISSFNWLYLGVATIGTALNYYLLKQRIQTKKNESWKQENSRLAKELATAKHKATETYNALLISNGDIMSIDPNNPISLVHYKITEQFKCSSYLYAFSCTVNGSENFIRACCLLK